MNAALEISAKDGCSLCRSSTPVNGEMVLRSFREMIVVVLLLFSKKFWLGKKT